MGLVKHDWFTFHVNGDTVEATVAEPLWLSPDLHTNLGSNPVQTVFRKTRVLQIVICIVAILA
jgi:hypothetical protein